MRLIQLFLFTILVSVNASALDIERIISFHSDIVVSKSTEIVVSEKITVYAMGQEIRRGIYRELPTSYEYKGGTHHVDIEVISLLKNGEPEPYHTEWMSNGFRLYAGSENIFLTTGTYTYELTYTVSHALGYFEDRDELYWNVNGLGWGFPVEKISANVYYPDSAELIAHIAYTGGYGSTGADYISNELTGGVHFETTHAFGPHEGMTISVGWSKGHLNYPTKMEEFLYWLRTYALLLICVGSILLGLLTNFWSWYKYGRDPKPGTIIPLFYPPKGMSPAECAYLNNNGRVTKTMFGGQLMSLAVKGYLNIDVDEGKGWGKKTTYTITEETKREKKGLLDQEQKFMSKLMGRSSTVTIKKGEYNPKVKNAHTSLISNIDKIQKGKYYLRNNHLKFRQFLFPVFTGVAGGVAIAMNGGSIPILVAAVIVQFIINLIFVRLFEQPTKEGRKVMDEILGYIMYMKYADKERIRMTNPPTMNFHHFEENLAYAIALGVAEEWAGQFDPVELEEFNSGHMPYYHGMAIASMADFSSSLSSTVSSAATPPSSSGSTSGGGGFSGGGGGGGGGGGW